MMWKFIVVVFSLLGLSYPTSGQIVQNGQCDTSIPLATNIVATQLLGTWYELRRAGNPAQNGDCSVLEFAEGTGGAFFTFQNRVLNRNFLEEQSGTYTVDGPTLSVNLNDEPVEISILAADNLQNLYAFAYRCEDFINDTRQIYIWQLVRNPTHNELVYQLLNTTIHNLFGLTTDDLERVDHSEEACYELPVIGENEPVILPGQCDADLSGVPAFDPEAFVGPWHEIYSYYTEDAVGTCRRSEFEVAGSNINLQNNWVVSQALQTTSGTATVVGPNGDGTLEITLEGVSETQTVIVLATDYTNYAVYYSCEDVTDSTKRVYSWIMGRSRQFSGNVSALVDDVVHSFLDLNYAYYQETARTDDDCFYYPDPIAGQPVNFRGTCDLNIPTQSNFDVDAYMGLWHDIESYPSLFQQGTCNNAYYTLNLPTVDVFNTQVVGQSLDSIEGVASLAVTTGEGKLTVEFPIDGTNQTVTTDYWILETDYTSYALVYTCLQTGEDSRTVWSWKLSRTKQLSPAANIAINNIIATVPVLDPQYFETKDQSVNGCFYFPEPQPGIPVVFPGRCDEAVPVLTTFNNAQFVGTWYEIESYPKEFQPGQCIDHEWSATGNNFNLQSSAIVNQFLQVSDSTVSPLSNDGSGRLVISLSNSDATIPFWIVNTDYTDYALAYSCVNLENNDDRDLRAIYSWKLSRTRTLSPAANVTINNELENNLVLGNQYFEPVSQTEEDCFFLPELEPGEPIILPGQCDQTLDVVRNFNVTEYEGLWHMIESYPSDFQNGDCNDATYALSNGEVIVTNTQVVDQTLDSIVGTATLVESTDGSAKLLVTFPGAPAPVEYWVLATDYSSYSFVYSCVDINSEERRVWSWKLSRTKTLTNDANNAINEVINNVNVLNQQYFEIIDNSDDACFYFPEANGQPLVFRGQCDENINVVMDFDVESYLGLWHDIESYPAVFQYGTCSNAYYALNQETEAVDVNNTQVVDQTLDTIEGVARLASNDNSAKLIVEFPIAGGNLITSSNYWVLATDYSSYALVYSCENYGTTHREVWSWKLSRTKQLSPAAQTNINSVISTIPVLAPQYYQSQDQSETGCFYFPEPMQGQTVIFPGSCESSANIGVVENFNMSRFAGVWHEIDAYPRDSHTGHCARQEFSLGPDTTLNLQAISVGNELLQVTESTVAYDNSFNSGELLLRTSDGTTMPYWIVDTDYDDYALIYSCIDLVDRPDFRAIYSWKLSRTPILSPAGSASINEATSGIVVLNDNYYEPINHSEEACFFYPVLGPNEPVVFVGQCDPNIDVVTNFDAEAYEGLWHLIESYPSDFQTGDCNDATYELSNGQVIVTNTQVINQALDSIVGAATLVESTDGSAKLLVTFPGASSPVEYWVLDTDYTSYSLVYSCVDLDENQRAVWSWKMSRSKSLTTNATSAIDEVMATINVLDSRYYYEVDNSDDACFYFPEANGEPLVFRGQCDETIAVAQDFDVERYMGLWHDIESYPSLFQQGTCNNAFYTLNLPTVDVFNTQVVGQALDTIDGIASLASDDGSAKLIVEFPIAGTNITTSTNYWVLDTDYTSYALVYTCDNINSTHRQVWSWKISRTKQLSPNAQANINAAVATVPVLAPQYYEPKDQSEAGCFYFPEPREGATVIFPGTCESDIGVVDTFNMAQFQDIWYEIETYPKDFQPGQCISHDYSAGTGNTLNLQTSAVDNETLQTAQSIISFAGTENNGRLVITMSDGMTIPFWILDTDYDDYALAYSCVDLVDRPDFRAIYSWKLSRSQSLSANANTAINTAMSNVVVLDDAYFEPVGQSYDDCFFYPELGPNEPVVFVGQCNPNINGVSNFNAELFAGRWYDIESYFDDFQGDCVDGFFDYTDNGFDIIFTQVVNENLEAIPSRATIVDNSGRLTVNIGEDIFTYLILSTDYINYAVVYECHNLDTESRRVRSWKLSKTRYLSSDSITAINDAINDINVLDDRYFSVRDHSAEGCFYFPTPVEGQTVAFRGECDETISVVQNFEVERYMGLWFDIESYPQRFQDGTCATATYTATESGVEVYNTQVLNQQEDTINGSAVLDSTDGSAKLLVTFPIAGTNLEVTTPYWVLATDYDNYALVYSCNRIDDEYVGIGAWKLSRNRSLSVESENQINNAMENVRVLRQEYFEETGHTEENCFFYPNNYGGPVYLDGQCPSAADVDVVDNFNAASFAGIWHEISRFPSELQEGECANSELDPTTTGQNSFSWTQNIILGERLGSVSGEAVISSDGRGIITVTVGGESTSLFILDTVYNDYALVYGCRNYTDETKQIYSWKLSRSRAGLSDAANNAIDVIVNENVDLFHLYYEETDQTDNGCFHYPVFDTLPDSIVLPGPCDERIQGIEGFDAARYMGRWFEIEKYPNRGQQGTCSQVHYSGPINEIYDISLLEVRNQTLEITTAVAGLEEGMSGAFEVYLVDMIDGEYVGLVIYVLDTDYTNFALVYGCRNLENRERQVFSWKLGRSRTLSNQDNNAINNAIANTQGLIQDYYTVTSQSEEDCFYIPPVNQNSAPVFRGSCQAVTGVPNFNLQQYSGWWHEIERYPVDRVIGQCVSSDIQLITSNSFRVVDTSVTGLEADVDIGTIVADPNGRLTRTYADGRTVESWVLATDYNSYSLLYSCEDFLDDNGDEYRRVWSAKHSKRRNLIESDHEAMNPFIEDHPLLYPQFYQTVDQTDATCFHYPDVSMMGDRIILPGTCQQNIPVQSSFDLDSFTGTWYQTERYPYPDVAATSTCIGTRYTLTGDDGELSVLNWEVNAEGVLESIEGWATPATDGSARLTVTIQSPSGENVTTLLHILSTDYNQYALLYACEDVNPFERAVTAFKLSRSRTMPASGTVSIDGQIQIHDVLHQQYFIEVSQDEECEEPSGGLLIKSSITVMLICAIWQLLS